MRKGGFVFKIIIIVLLIFFEATIDIEITEYIAQITNVGLVNKGIEYDLPKFIKEKHMNLLQYINDENVDITKYYHYVSKNQAREFKKYNIIYKDNIYVLNDSVTLENIDDDAKAFLNKVFTLYSGAVREKVLNVIKESLSQEQYDQMMMAISDNNIPEFEQSLNLLSDDAKQRINSVLEEESKNMNDAVFDQVVSSLNIFIYRTLGINLNNIQKAYTGTLLKQMILMILAILVIQLISIRLIVNVTSNISEYIKYKTIKKTFDISNYEVNKIGISKIEDITVNDTKKMEMILPIVIREIIYAPIVMIKGITIIISKSNFMVMGIIFGSILLSFLLTLILLIIVKPKFDDNKKLEDLMKVNFKNIISGITVIKSFGKEKLEESKFEKINEKSMVKNRAINIIISLSIPLAFFIIVLMIALLTYFGAKYVESGIMQVGEIIEFSHIAFYIMSAFIALAIISVLLPVLLNAISRVRKVLRTPEDKGNGTIEVKGINKKIISLQDVSVEIDDKTILNDTNIRIMPGKVNAIIGETGSGKSTVINLILQNIRPTKGRICIDEINIEEILSKNLKDSITIASQENYIFSGTLKENFLLVNRNITVDKMRKICKIADLNDFIDKQGKLDFKIVNGGVNVSGGQKQRIAIANAIAKDFDVLILDDSFSSLDINTETRIKQNLREEYPDKTIIIISQKIVTVKDADNIIVMQNGKNIAEGKHLELQEKCKLYKDLVDCQIKEEY